jgi:hypothetical protein
LIKFIPDIQSVRLIEGRCGTDKKQYPICPLRLSKIIIFQKLMSINHSGSKSAYRAEEGIQEGRLYAARGDEAGCTTYLAGPLNHGALMLMQAESAETDPAEKSVSFRQCLFPAPEIPE